MNKPQKSIGIFDSGIGGLTVANAILNILPKESIVYFGDTAHLPYGDKSPEIIKKFCRAITSFLLQQEVKMIVIACNSASAAAFELVRKLAEEQQVTVINVIDPVVDYIVSNKFNHVGIIGTRATIGSKIFPTKIKIANPAIEVSALATPLLAPMIESGFVKGDISRTVIETYLADETLNDIDALVLACTHYPLIKREIEEYYKNNHKNVNIIATNEIVAQAVLSTLESQNLINKVGNAQYHFFVSDYTDSFKKTTQLFYDQEVSLKQIDIFKEE
ncbi:MAG: glutamate racemase [Chitinophagales bacterium]|nr:glutamate racemase [Chitinophagales bacterium]MCZ2394137.1 glutamate racemase [Chitinophagales bacterium]